MSSKRKAITVSLITLGVDQLTKLLVYRFLSLRESVPVVGDFVRITFIKNPYGIFGLQFKVPFIPVTILAVCVVFLILYRSGMIPLALILGGAIGNLIDRLRFSAVIDFLDIGVRHFRWPVFNVADTAITVGILWIIIRGLKKK